MFSNIRMNTGALRLTRIAERVWLLAVRLPSPPPLADLAAERPLALFLDFDGTLVDIADTPDGILVPADLPRKLLELRDRMDHRLAIVTGRALEDLEKYLGRPDIARAGGHGAERIDAAGEAVGAASDPLPDDVRVALRAFASLHDLTCEDKGGAMAVHYRNRPDIRDELLMLAQSLAERRDVRLSHGKCVIELTAAGADKGTAVTAFLQRPPFIGAQPIFVGDDVTDEDGFAAASAAGGFGVNVGERVSRGARYGLDSPDAVHHWLGLA